MLKFPFVYFALILCCIAFPSKTIAQKQPTYQKAKSAPFWVNNNPLKLARYLTKDLSDEKEKVIAISSWIGHKIKYDLHGLQKGRLEEYSSKKVLRRRRRAMCSEYANLFKEMCEEVGIESIVVSGYTHLLGAFNGDTLYRADHAWSLAKVNGEWFLFDLTWASGYRQMRLQLIRRFMFMCCKIPFKPKFRQIQKMDEEMCFANPETFILEHYPLINDFQLLPHPISYSAFINGSDSIEIELQNSKLPPQISPDDFHQQNELQQWEALSKYSFENNPKNHRAKGIYDCLYVDSIKRKYIDSISGLLLMPPDDLARLKLKAEVSDSFLFEALNDNKTEFNFYNNRSRKWKDDLKRVNKKLKTLITASIKSNNLERKMLIQTKKKMISGAKLATKKSKSIRSSEITKTKRPKKENESKETQAKLYLEIADSLHTESQKKLHFKDSIFSLLNWDFYNKIIQNEKNLLGIRKDVKQNHKLLLFSKMFFGVNYYSDTNLIHKPIMDSTLNMASEQNLAITDSLVLVFKTSQLLAYTQMKTYSKIEGKSIKAIKKAKRKSFYGQGEDELFNGKLEDYRAELLRYKTSVKRIKGDKKIIKLMKISNKKLKKLSAQLTKEINYETFRHQSYKNYLKAAKNYEDNVVKEFRKLLNQSLRSIIKTENYREKQRESNLVK